MCPFLEQVEKQNDRESLIVMGKREKGGRILQQADRVALNMNMDSSAVVTRGKAENTLQTDGVCWVW